VSQQLDEQRTRQIRRTVRSLVAAFVGMCCLAYASVPLYRIFCQETGFGGTTQRVDSAPSQAGAREITVRFDASVAQGMPWEFAPDQVSVKVHVGEPTVISYHAINKTNQPVTGQATFNVTPLKAGIYFDKIQCFCFNEQTLKPGEGVDMAVQFFVDPGYYKNPDVRNAAITLSYTFFRAADDQPAAGPKLSQLPAANQPAAN
jgi:cytochrome c oxidase assembly protein subunit 11